MQRYQGRVVVQVSVTSVSAGMMVPDSGEMDRMERDAFAVPNRPTAIKNILIMATVHATWTTINMFSN